MNSYETDIMILRANYLTQDRKFSRIRVADLHDLPVIALLKGEVENNEYVLGLVGLYKGMFVFRSKSGKVKLMDL